MDEIRLYLLGPFQAMSAGQPVRGFAYDKVRALLAYLAVESQHPHSRETLAALLWPEANDKTARTNLRKALSTLRKALCDDGLPAPCLIIQRDSVQINPRSHLWLDVDQLKSRLDSALNHTHLQFESCESCVHDLEEAAELYRGSFLQGLMIDSLEFEEWSLTMRENLHTRMLSALHELTQYYLHRGDYGLAQKHALRQVELEPYREEAHRALMHSLSRSGQRSAALAQYERCRGILAAELGVDPSQETRALYEHIRNAGETQPNNLPSHMQPLVGREAELQQISRQLANPDCRLLTLVGMGGIGKTRLALQAARENLGDFLHGVFWVPLAALHDPDQVLAAVMEALPLTPGNDPQTQLLDYFRDKVLLLVLDNFEHLIPAKRKDNGAALDLLNQILSATAQIQLLVTSRTRLSLRAEWVLQIEGLPHPKNLSAMEASSLPEYAAIQLFVQRARQVVSAFPEHPAAYPQIARICQLLQGIPLGIELAAGWVDQHSCQEIAAAIAADPDFLVSPLRDVPDRHQSLRAVFNHSWQLLDPTERAVLSRLAVFQTVFSRAAAREVSGAEHYLLTALVNKSLLQAETGGNFSMHQLLKQFLRQELDSNPETARDTRQAHAAFFARFLKEREFTLTVQFKGLVLDEVETVLADVRAAWDWAVQQKDGVILSGMLESLYTYYWARNQFATGLAAFEKAATVVANLEQSTQNQLLLARLWSRIADFTYWQDDLKLAEERLLESIAVLKNLTATDELAFAFELLSRVYYWQGAYHKSKDAGTAAIEHARAANTPHYLAQALSGMANVICEESGNYKIANELYSQSLKLYQELENPFGIAKTLVNQGAIFYEQQDYARAQELYRQSLQRYREINYVYGISACLNNLAIIARRLGKYEEAKALIAESLAMKRETGNHVSILHSLLEIGVLHLAMDEYPAARGYFQEALQLTQKAQATGMLHNVVLGFAELYSKTGAEQRAAELVNWVLAQENVGQEALAQAETICVALKKKLSADEWATSRSHGGGKKVDTLVTEILAS